MMRGVLAAALSLLLAGCVVVTPDPTPEPQPDIMFELVNPTAYQIDANFFVSATALDPRTLFVAANIYTAYSTAPIPTLNPGATARFTLPCDQVAAIGVRRPVFADPLTLSGGEATVEVLYRRDVAYRCGDRLRVTYVAEDGKFDARVEKF